MLRLLLALCLLAQAETRQIVFIHGIKGSRLVDENKEVSWVTGSQVLGLSTPKLSLPMLFAGGPQPRDRLRAQSPLDWIPVIPPFYKTAVYGPWMEKAIRLGSFAPFAYDWRRDNRETVDEFLSYLKGFHRPVQVVAHSMGGLIALAALHREPQLFHSVVFAGVPFAGGIGFLVDLHEGTKTGLNSKILSKEVLATFPSVYTLFPETGEPLVDLKGKALSMDFYSAEDWRKRRLGLFAYGPHQPYQTFLADALARGKEFRTWLKPKAMKYPPILVVSGRSQPTLVKAIGEGPKAVRGWDFETAPKAPGDGRVVEAQSLPPEGIPYVRFLSTKEHSDLLNDPAVIERIRTFP